MIVRTRHGCVSLQYVKDFALHLQQTGVTHAKGIAGNCGAYIHSERQSEWQHFFLATYWQDLAAIITFAGQDYSVASPILMMNG